MKKQAAVLLAAGILIIFAAAAARAMELPPLAAADPDPDPRTDRLCAEAADPEAAADKIHIHCKLEYGAFAPAQPAAATAPNPAAASVAPHELLVVAYNLERGMKFDQQVELLKSDSNFGRPDVLLVSEADRGCSRTGFRNVARDLAKALGMNYLYGVEYVELPRKSKLAVDDNATTCEHGNAVLSRYPILGAEQIRHTESINWYLPPGPGRDNNQPRLGGCMAIAADLDVAGATLRVYAVHLDGNYELNDLRGRQVKELLVHAAGFSGPIVMGGDMNTIVYMLDIQNGTHKEAAPAAFIAGGYKDAHAGLPAGKRNTVGKQYPMRLALDNIFLHGPEVVAAGVCPQKTCNGLSDHMPVWARIKF